MKLRLAACIVLLGVATLSPAQDKKNLTVRTDSSTSQVNNHPWSHTTPGQASTNCSTNGTVNATGATSGNTTKVDGTVNASTNCNSTYKPAQTTNGNAVTVDNASWVTDINSGDRYLIQCTAHWRGSKCSYLEDGTFKAVLEGNTMWITGSQGMKEMTGKYHVVRYSPGKQSASTAPSNFTSVGLTADELFTWQWYNTMPDEDRKYVAEFCPANPMGKALLPRAKINAGEAAERALYCQPWLSAKAKQ
jgi:hypothetical protein